MRKFPFPGLALRDPDLTGPKNVDGFMSGYAVSEGGGRDVGKMCVDDANEAWGLVLGSMGDCGGIPAPSAPAPAKTCGGIAWMSVSSCCIRSSKVAARL